MKRFGQLLIVALFATTAWTTSAKAVENWFIVDLVMTGTQDLGDTYVNLTDTAGSPAFTGTWFKVADPIKREALAIALTTVATGSSVFVRADPDALPVPLVLKFFIVK